MLNLRTTELSHLHKLIIVLGCTAIFSFAIQINSALASQLGLEPAHWAFLTGGLQLILILIFVELGALGITLASMLMSTPATLPYSMWIGIGAAIIQGAAPWLAHRLAVNGSHLNRDLTGLNARHLLYLSLFFSIVSASMSQLWLFWWDQSPNFIQDLFTLSVSSWLGTACLLSLLSITARKIYTWVRL